MSITAKFTVQNVRTTKARGDVTVRERLTLAGPDQTALTIDLPAESFGKITQAQKFDVTLTEAKS